MEVAARDDSFFLVFWSYILVYQRIVSWRHISRLFWPLARPRQCISILRLQCTLLVKISLLLKTRLAPLLILRAIHRRPLTLDSTRLQLRITIVHLLLLQLIALLLQPLYVLHLCLYLLLDFFEVEIGVSGGIRCFPLCKTSQVLRVGLICPRAPSLRCPDSFHIIFLEQSVLIFIEAVQLQRLDPAW